MRALLLLLIMSTAGCAATRDGTADIVGLTSAVTATEQSFAETMRERDFAGFQAFLADDVVFIAGQRQLRGKAAVAGEWAQYFEGAAAPFSWQPETVAVQDTGMLALSSGPVHAADGRLLGTFTSIWRRMPDGSWRIIFDKGGCACD